MRLSDQDPDRASILLVDDRHENLVALEALLHEFGHRLVSVQSGEAAVEAVRGEEFALVLLDVRMPGMTGLEAATTIRSLDRGKTTPIVFVTANGTLPGNVSPYAAGAVDVLVKPLDVESLRAKVKTFTELWHLRTREARHLRAEVEHAAEAARRVAAQKDERRRELLAKATQVFAGSLEISARLEGIANIFVPDMADWVGVQLCEDDGALTLVACAHVDREKRGLVEAVAARLASTAENAAKNAANGPEHAHSLQVDEALVRDAVNGEQAVASSLRALAPRSIIHVPMLAQGRRLGTITMGSGGDRRPYADDDAHVAEDLARHAASAIDIARLFQMAKEERWRADEANRTKDEFLAVISHELRTPLNAMMGWSKMLVRGALDEATTRKAVETIERNARTQARLIEDLLDISRIMTGKLRLEVEDVSMIEVIEMALEVVRASAESKQVSLEPVLHPLAGKLVGDPNRLQQAVWNLLSNAVKFSPPGGKVVVRLEPADSGCVVTVEDNGPGIEADFLPYVFDRFRQAEMSSARKYGGLGLGLSIVKHIAELHGGTVSVTSEGLGHGAVFRLCIPDSPLMRRARPGLTPPSRPALRAVTIDVAHAKQIEGLSILIVDDEADARDMLGSMLEQCNVSVSKAASADEAMRALREHGPDVIISDIGMPIEDGYSFIGRVRSLSVADGGATPAIALTAYARTADRTKALLAGFDMHVPKPIDPGELLAVLARVVEQRVTRA